MANTLNTPTRREAAHSPEPFRLLDTNQAAAALGIGRRTLQERVEAREIAFVKIGRCTRFHPEDLADFVARNRRQAAGWKGGRA